MINRLHMNHFLLTINRQNKAISKTILVKEAHIFPIILLSLIKILVQLNLLLLTFFKNSKILRK
jgi:hypothetical protein